MISVIDRKQTDNGTLKKYVADTYSELQDSSEKVCGNIAYCIEDKSWYLLNSLSEWVKLGNSEDLTEIWEVINNKQNKLTFDTTPTDNSTNPVTSGGIKSAISEVINNKQNKLTFDTTPTDNSTNPVTSGGIKSAISEVIIKAFQNYIPIGYIYIQLASQSSPTNLFGGTWANISGSYAGRFFRAEGGNAAAFGSSQAEGLPNISGSLKANRSFMGDGGSTSGLVSSYSKGSNANGDQQLSWSGSYGQYNCTINFNARNSNSIYGSSNNVTPVNSTIRIWKKTAN